MQKRQLGWRRPTALAAVCLLSAVSCRAGENPPVESIAAERAYIQRTCAPWDGAATTLYLADSEAVDGRVPPPLLLISVYEGIVQASGKRYRLTPATDNLGAAQACSEDGCVWIPEAVVDFGRIDERAPVPVTVRVTSEDDRVKEGQFEAIWLDAADLCG